MDRHLLEVKDLQVNYNFREGPFKVVNKLSFFLDESQTLSIVGESGSGKTTIALSVMGLLTGRNGNIENGQILFQGKDLIDMEEAEYRNIRGNQIAMIFQDPLASLNPSLSIGNQIMEMIRVHKKVNKAEAKKQTIELLEKVGLSEARTRITNYPHQFSGGMRQRALIAMSLSCQPKVLIADEPTAALDVTIQAQILELLKTLQEELGMAVVLITHDLGVAANTADWILVVYGGKLIEYARTEDIFYKSRHPYTRGLIRSMPSYISDESGRMNPIHGQPPGLRRIIKGCSFHPRCDYAHEKCKKDIPPRVKVSKDHYSACHFANDFNFSSKKYMEVG